MKDRQSSITASGIALARAIESEKLEGVRVCFDPYAAKFLNPLFYRFMRIFIVSGYAERAGPGVNGYLVARARFIDEVLQASLNEGIEQLVVLGAGLDSRAYRFDDIKKGVRVFEIDHPATQRNKIKKVKSVLGELPGNVTYVGIEFNTQSLEDRLPQCGYDEAMKTLFIWEGVVMYLSATAVDNTLSFITRHSAAGSRVVFDYIYTALLDGSVRHGEISRIRRARPISGEGLTFSIPEGKLGEFLLSRGFRQIRDIPSAELHQLYFTGINAKRKVAWGYGIALAEI